MPLPSRPVRPDELTSGVYTPVRSAEANLDSNITFTQAKFIRVGDIVSVSGTFTADPTLTTTATSFEMTLPVVVSGIISAGTLTGQAVCGIISEAAEIIGSTTNRTAKVQWKAIDTTSRSWSYNFSYLVT